MDRLFIGKFTIKEQYEGNYYHIKLENEISRFNGLKEGDYVLPSHGGYFGKLLLCNRFEKKDGGIAAIFEVIKSFSPELTLSGNIVCCKYFKPDMNLLNKIVKSTKGYGFHEISLEENCPNFEIIDFYKSQRRFLVVLKEILSNTNIFKPSDICIVIDNLNNTDIQDIVEFNGQKFNKYEALWNLYQEKVENGAKKYSLQNFLSLPMIGMMQLPKKKNI